VDDAGDPHDREADDAPRRRRVLVLAVFAGLLIGVVGFVLLRPSPAPPPPPPPPPVAAEEPPPPPPPPPPVIEEPPPPPKKASVSTPKPKAATPSTGTSSTSIALTAPIGGDKPVREALVRAFRGGLRGVPVVDVAGAGYAITLAIEDQQHAGKGGVDEVTVKCTVSIAEMPRKTLKASLRARADAAGEGVDVDELFADAAVACGKTLGGDLSAWLKKNPR
jgi:hypothetical protein